MVFMMFYCPKFVYIGSEEVPKVLGKFEVKRQRKTKTFNDYFYICFYVSFMSF